MTTYAERRKSGPKTRQVEGATWTSLVLMLYLNGLRRVVVLGGLTDRELKALAVEVAEEIDRRTA